jgi:metal-responsive CopG/Arc/MetJ family transcriptional regulator
MNQDRPRQQKRSERLQVELSKEELNAIDDFRFEYRMPSRAEAVREILRYGLGMGIRRNIKLAEVLA